MTKAKTKPKQSDSAYLLKLVLYMIIGSQWLFFVNEDLTTQIPIPAGFIIGLLFTAHEHFKIDRKIEYALLLVAMFVGFWVSMGIEVVL